MHQHRIATEVREFVVENFLLGDGMDLSNTSSFLDAAVIDSTGILELVGFLESRYEIVIEDGELVPANLDSVERVTRFVLQKLAVRDKTVAS